MKRIVTILAAIILAVLNTNVYAQKNKTENDYNLKKAYEVFHAQHHIERLRRAAEP